jgi:MFS family permease
MQTVKTPSTSFSPPAAAANDSSTPTSPWAEFRQDRAWRVVLAAWLGIALGLTALPFYSLGIFAKPLALEFGWSRSVIQSGILFSMLGVISSAWATGWLIDRFGVRPVALFSQLGLAAGFIGLAVQSGSPLWWKANWFVFAVLGVGTTPITWSRGIASWFDQRRGLAMGIALSGTGMTALLAPPVLGAIVSAHGWRVGYVCLALAIVLVGVPAVWFMFQERAGVHPSGPRPTTSEPSSQSGAAPAGLSLREALGTRYFWIMLIGFWAICATVAGLIPNLVPMLTDSGLSLAQAASYASLMGLMVIAGRLVAGWLLDRFWGPLVAFVLLMPPALACVLLSQQLWPGLAVMLIGLAGGAEFDLIAFLCLRYFGTRHFGQIYAWQWAGFSLAAGAGPVAFGAIFDHFGSYHHALMVSAVLLVIGPVLLFALGRYPAAFSPQPASHSPKT